MRLLLVEDSPRLQRSVGDGLRHAGYAVDVSGSGTEGLWYARANDYDVLILDIMLPGLDGLTILQRLREAGNQSSVLLLTAKDTIEDRVKGLGTGADDYLVKPFAFEELLARVQALARRRHGNRNPVITIGDLRIETVGRRVTRAGHPIDLTAREYALLEFLALRAGQVVSRTQIESGLYDEGRDPMSNVIDAAVYSLRRKIDLPGSSSRIQTRRGMGYVLTLGDA